ncbi:MAG: putative membrane protein [Alteromonadaceae bacterium]
MESFVPLIDGNNTITLLAMIMALVALGFWSENTSLGKKISAPLVILMSGLVLGNFGVIPHNAPLYDAIQSLLVPIAIPLLLFRADLVKVFKESGTMLLAFGLATTFTVLGVFIAAGFVDLGELEGKIAGVLASSYIGGSANFVATSEAVQFTDSSAYLSTFAADAIGAVVFLMLLMSLPASSLIRKLLPSKHIEQSENLENDDTLGSQIIESKNVTMTGVAYGITLSLIICVLGSFIAENFVIPGMFIITITILSLLVANFAKKQINKVHFDFEIGSIFMYIFFATIGASANFSNILDSAFYILVFLIIVILVHISMLLLFGYLFKLDLAELMVASSACILGPAAAAAMAAGQGWRSLVSPGMLVGVLGYAIATFIGITITSILS